jgi:hypothetical protein
MWKAYKIMGIINCQKHETQGLSDVCPHIRELTILKQQIEGTFTLVIDVSGFNFKFTFCSSCMEKYTLPYTNKVLPESLFEEFERRQIPIEPMCGICLKNAAPQKE